MSYDSKYWCSCGNLHWSGDSCPKRLESTFRNVVREMGPDRAKKIVDEIAAISKKNAIDAAILYKTQRIESLKRKIEQSKVDQANAILELEKLEDV